jgi:DNA polymerase V
MLAPVAEPSTPSAFPPWWARGSEPTADQTAGWPLLATPVPAGFPSPADDHVERRLSLDDHLIRHPEATFFMRVQGDELRDQGIHDGDLLVVDRAAAPSTGSVVVAVTEGQFCLARVARNAQGRRVLHAAANATPGSSQTAALTLWGVVRWSLHRLWPARDRLP